MNTVLSDTKQNIEFEPWMEMGMDSLSMTELVNIFNKDLCGKLHLNQTSLFDYPTPNVLAGLICVTFSHSTNTSCEIIYKDRQVEPLAIIGMACNFPGNSENIDQFWTTLKDGIDCVRGITRFDTL